MYPLVKKRIPPPQAKNPIIALLGNHAGVVDAGDGLSYATLISNGQVVKVVNNRVGDFPQLVELETSPNRPNVFSVVGPWGVHIVPGNPGVKAHAPQHAIGGFDVDWITLDRITWLLCKPYASDSFVVQQCGGVGQVSDVLVVVEPCYVDLTAHVPTTGALYVLLQYDALGVVTHVVGTPVDSVELLTIVDIPSPDVDNTRSCAVRLYESQPGLRRDKVVNDFVDLRFGSAPSSSGYTPPTTTAENDFQVGGVGGTAGEWVTKTLAQVKTILGAMLPAAHDQNASTVIIPSGLGTPAYDDLQDFLNTTRSAGRFTGGVVSKGTGATVSITAMEGMIFTGSTLGTSPLIYFKMPAQTDILGTGAAPNLIDVSVNWIYIDYAGGTPVYKATIDRSTINDYTMFAVARAWVSGATVEVQASGHSLYNKDRRSHNRLILKYSGMDHVSGATITAHATPLRLSCDAGSWYVANTSFTTPLVDQFTVMYRTGGGAWTQSALLTLFSEVFDGGTSKVFETYQNGTSLAALTGNHYGVYWIFICPQGHLNVVLGDATYANIGAAQAATVPASLPARCTNWSRLIGRVICKKTNATLYSVETVWATSFTLSAAVDHASLANLAYASAGHTGFVPSTRTITATAPITIAGTTSADLSADRTIAIVPATAAVPGSMSAADFEKLSWLTLTALNAFTANVNRFGDTLPFYLIANYPTLGLNAYYSAGWKYGAGSSSNYCGVFELNTTTGVFKFRNTANTGNADAAATLRDVLSIALDGTITMPKYGVGTATFSAAGVISSVSDERLKTKDGEIKDPIPMLMKLKPGYYYSKEETIGEGRQLGFYAQNVQKAIGKEAAPDSIGDTPMGYYDRSVLAVAIEALKLHEKRISELETELKELKGKK